MGAEIETYNSSVFLVRALGRIGDQRAKEFLENWQRKPIEALTDNSPGFADYGLLATSQARRILWLSSCNPPVALEVLPYLRVRDHNFLAARLDYVGSSGAIATPLSEAGELLAGRIGILSSLNRH